jgi:hypothetical protein
MHRLTILLAVVALAATTSIADAAKKGKKKAAAAPPAAAQTIPDQPGLRLIGGYFQEVGKAMQPRQPQQTAAKGKKKK